MKEVEDKNNELNNNDVNSSTNTSDEKQKRREELKRKKKEAEEEHLKNLKSGVIEYKDYKEYETWEDIENAMESQKTPEDLLFQYSYLSTRSYLIKTSSKYLSEKERVDMGMYPRAFDKKMKPVYSESPLSAEQNINFDKFADEMKHSIRADFFADSETGKKKITVEGCRKFLETIGRTGVMPYVELGRKYDQIRRGLDIEGNTEEDLDFKTNYIIDKAFPKEAMFANDIMVNLEVLKSTFNDDELANKGFIEFASNVSVTKFVKQEMDAYKDKSINEFMDYLQITDREEKNSLLDKIGCDANTTLEDCLNKIKGFDKVIKGEEKEFLSVLIQNAWENQGKKQVLETLSDKDQVAWKRGIRAMNTRVDHKHSRWMKEYADPLIRKINRENYKSTIKEFNRKIVSTEPVGPRFSDKRRPVTFSNIDEKYNAAQGIYKIEPVDAKKNEAIKKYDNYIKSHTGQNMITTDNKSNVELLAKNMAASMLKRASYTKVYSESMLKSLADKLTKSLQLDKMKPDEVSAALMDEKSVRRATRNRSVKIYLPKDADENIKNENDNLNNEQIAGEKNIVNQIDGLNDPKVDNNEVKLTSRGFVNELSVISHSMLKADNRSEEYKAMAKYIKNIGSLESYYMKTNDGKAELVENTINLLEATEKYMKGKKSVRYHDDGKERFNTALDILSVMHKYLPELRERIDAIVDRVNKVRGAEKADHKHHIDLSEFGNDRAYDKASERIKNDSGASKDFLAKVYPTKEDNKNNIRSANITR